MKRYHFGPRLAVMMAVIALILALCEASGVAVSVPEAVEEHVRVSEELRRREAEEWRECGCLTPWGQHEEGEREF